MNAYFKGLPKDAVIAGDPRDLMCVPATARRPVVISTQLAPSYEADYFRSGRARMFATLRAYYGQSTEAIADLMTSYGATYLWVRRDAIQKEMADGGIRWRDGQLPYGRYVRQLLRSGEPAVLHLPTACRRWHLGGAEVYDIRCIASAGEAVADSGKAREVAVEGDDVGTVLDGERREVRVRGEVPRRARRIE